MSFEVVLHIYDLSQGMAAQFSRALIGRYVEGIWHTGIVVYGKEYYFGGGISYDPPRQTPFGTVLPYNRLGMPTKTQMLGKTELPFEVFMEYLREISPRFTE